MKIDFSANLNVYRKNTAGAHKTTRGETAQPKTDVAAFSRCSGAPPDKALSALKNSIISDVARGADSARLQELSRRVKDGTYAAPTDELVDAMLQ